MEPHDLNRISVNEALTSMLPCSYTCVKSNLLCEISPVAERPEERAVAVPGGQDLCQILQDVGDDVYQQYRLTRQGSDFDSQSAFHINVSVMSGWLFVRVILAMVLFQ